VRALSSHDFAVRQNRSWVLGQIAGGMRGACPEAGEAPAAAGRGSPKDYDRFRRKLPLSASHEKQAAPALGMDRCTADPDSHFWVTCIRSAGATVEDPNHHAIPN
jgi:hypothetical protein